MSDRKPASAYTTELNRSVLDQLPFEDRRDFEDAARGLISPLPEGPVLGETGMFAFDPERLSFVDGEAEAPETVNPSLWRQAALVARGGLFQVCERIYQVRNMDLSNMTLIEGDTGLIVVDPLISMETARAALGLYFQHRPKVPVVAVVHSHSHVDHYGGVRGVVEQADVDTGKVRIIAPEGFLQAAISENVLAGNVMSRRSQYQFGPLLAADPQGTLGAGIGTGVSLGTISLIPPTEEVTPENSRLEIDGLTFDFMLTPDTEAPAEMHWFIDELSALTAAENCLHTLHNTYPIRGAQVRDPLAWSTYLNETLIRWADRAEVMYGMHHWPVWGRDRIIEMLTLGRDAYRYINDETLRLANHGLTPEEIAEQVAFPEQVARHWATREYYGTVSHNVKATYTRYLGWFDGNPAKLNPLPPVESANRYVQYMGGADAVLAKAREAFEGGEYRWVAQVVNHVVFDDPANQQARDLAADAMEQLGYQSESATWRNAYLTAAQELRLGTPDLPIAPESASPDTIAAMSLPMLFNFLAVRLNGERAPGTELRLNLILTDTGEEAALEVVNGVLNNFEGLHLDGPDATLSMDRETLGLLVAGKLDPAGAIQAGRLEADPGVEPLEELFGLLDDFSLWFPIIEP